MFITISDIVISNIEKYTYFLYKRRNLILTYECVFVCVCILIFSSLILKKMTITSVLN